MTDDAAEVAALLQALFSKAPGQDSDTPELDIGNHVPSEGSNPQADQDRTETLNFARAVFGYDPN